MRRFTFKADLRKAREGSNTEQPIKKILESAAPKLAKESLALSSALRKNRQNMRQWPAYQSALRSLESVDKVSSDFENQELALEWLRIYEVTKDKILDAAPGFSREAKTETHCFFSETGSKHLLSRLSARPNARITELSLYPSGELTRIYYEHLAGPEQECEQLYINGLTGLEEDIKHFARFPHYHLRFVLLVCENHELVDICKGRFFYDPASAEVVSEEEDLN